MTSCIATTQCVTIQATFNPAEWLEYREGHTAGHLFDGLSYLLRAAQEWKTQEELNLEVDGDLTTVYAMDSTFLRARSMFEFFVGKGRNYCHSMCLFGLPNQQSYPAYSDNTNGWSDMLHVGSMHYQNRGVTTDLLGHDRVTLKPLNQMPVDFALGVLDIWENFEADLGAVNATLALQAKNARKEAVRHASKVAASITKRAEAYTRKAPALTPTLPFAGRAT